jgi:ATP-dependent exoDNAse (exonuclease V) alpha subunit
MILQLEALELHQLETIVTDKNGIPLDRNTDAIRYQSKKGEINISNYFWDKEKTIPKYQTEEPTPLKHESMPHLVRYNNLKQRGEFDLRWEHFHSLITVKKILERNQGMLINGRAGTGKTYLVNQLILAIKEMGAKYACLAPTNKSARLIEGDTLDSLSFKSIFNNKKLVQWALSINYLIVDEISMVKEKFYRLLTNIKKINPKIIFFVCGDFEQLKPVNDSWNGDYENSPVLLDLCQNNKLILTKCRRSDEKLFNLCQNVNEVNIEDFPMKVETNLNIAYYHSTRKQVNEECMERNLTLQNDKPIEIQEDENNPKTQHLKLVKGMPIICHRTCKKMELLNSDRFTITSINEKNFEFTNELLIEKGKEPMKMELKDFHRYFYLAYCITVHASQGETFKEPYTIYDWGRMCRRGKYVSLSRGTEMDNIQIHIEKIEQVYLDFKKILLKNRDEK